MAEPFTEPDDPNRCPSRVIYRGKTAAWCGYVAGHPGRHHNGTRGWNDGGTGVTGRSPIADGRSPIADGEATWAAYLATGNPVGLTAATRAELADALRLARDEVLRLRGPLT